MSIEAMKRDEVIRMAREAGAIPIHKDYKQNALVGNENIERFAQMVAAAAVASERTALKLARDELVYVLTCINANRMPFDGDDFHEALRAANEALEAG